MNAAPNFPQIHGHRGCRGLLPENTLPAFRRAVALGVDAVELDVVVSADWQVVVSHEPWMSASICRTPAGQRIEPAEAPQHNLYALPYGSIRQYDCGLTQHPAFPEQQSVAASKPLLRAVVPELEALAQELGRPPVWYSVEIKSDPVHEPRFQPAPATLLNLVLTELHTLGVLARTTLLCFDKRVLRLAHELAPTLRLCLLVEDTLPLAGQLAELGFRPSVYGPHHSLVTAELVQHIRQLALELVPWTVNAPADMLRILAFQPTGITTDYPDRLLALRGAV